MRNAQTKLQVRAVAQKQADAQLRLGLFAFGLLLLPLSALLLIGP